MTSLKKLYVSDGGKIPTIKDLSHHASIETLHLVGNTTIEDGDISVFLTLPNLKDGFVRMRQHYNLKTGVFKRIGGKILASKLDTISKEDIRRSITVKELDPEDWAKIQQMAVRIEQQKKKSTNE